MYTPSTASVFSLAVLASMVAPALAAPTPMIDNEAGLEVRDSEELETRALMAREALDDLIQHLAMRDISDSFLERRTDIANDAKSVWDEFTNLGSEASKLVGHSISGVGQITAAKLGNSGGGSELQITAGGSVHKYKKPAATLRPGRRSLERRTDIANDAKSVWDEFTSLGSEASKLVGHSISGVGQITAAKLGNSGSGSELQITAGGSVHKYKKPAATLRPGRRSLERRTDIANDAKSVWDEFTSLGSEASKLVGHSISGVGEITAAKLGNSGSGSELQITAGGSVHKYKKPAATLRPGRRSLERRTDIANDAKSVWDEFTSLGSEASKLVGHSISGVGQITAAKLGNSGGGSELQITAGGSVHKYKKPAATLRPGRRSLERRTDIANDAKSVWDEFTSLGSEASKLVGHSISGVGQITAAKLGNSGSGSELQITAGGSVHKYKKPAATLRPGRRGFEDLEELD